MRISDNNRLHYQSASLPSGKLLIVLQKYIMVFIFFWIGILTELVLDLLLNLFGPGSSFETLLTSINVSILGVLRVAIFVLPLFFMLKDTRKAFLLFLTWLIDMATIHIPLTLELLYARNSIEATVFIYFLMFAGSILSAAVLYYKDMSKLNPVYYLVVPIAVIFPISLALLQEIINSLIHSKVLIHFMPDNFDQGRMEWIINKEYPYLFVHLIPTVILFLTGLYIWKNGGQRIRKMISNLSLILLLPVAFFAMQNSVMVAVFTYQMVTKGVEHAVDYPLFSVSQYIIFIPMLIVSIYYSKKFLTEGGK